MTCKRNQIIITVTGKDKVGIVACVSKCLAGYKVNIKDIKQTTMKDNFIMIMTCDISDMNISFNDLKEKVCKLCAELKTQVWVQKSEAFDKTPAV